MDRCEICQMEGLGDCENCQLGNPCYNCIHSEYHKNDCVGQCSEDTEDA